MFWVDHRRAAPDTHYRKGTKATNETRRLADYIREHAPVHLSTVYHEFGMTEKRLRTQLTTLTYLLPVYEDERGVLNVL
jgi:hypothetical protein